MTQHAEPAATPLPAASADPEAGPALPPHLLPTEPQARSRVTSVVRWLLALWLLVVGWHFLMDDLGGLAAALEAAGVTTAWPLYAGTRPVALALYLSSAAFFIGLFLLGGLLNRIMALLALPVVVPLGGALGWLPFPALAALACVYLVLRGGGAYTMDAAIGRMQRKASLRELEREWQKRRAADGGP